METKNKISGNERLLSGTRKFEFDMTFIYFEDMREIYAHFNLKVDDKVTSKEQLFSSFEPEDNAFVKKMAYISALLAHNCINIIHDQVYFLYRKGESRYVAYNKFIMFELDFPEAYEDCCEDGISLETLIEDYGLEELAPVFSNHHFVRSVQDN